MTTHLDDFANALASVSDCDDIATALAALGFVAASASMFAAIFLA